MGELGEKNSESRTVLEQYRLLKQTALKKFPEIVQDAVIERDPGDNPRNLRIFLADESFLDVWLSKQKYSFHWQKKDKIIRFDNAPHHKQIDTFPDHMHIKEKVKESPVNGNIKEKFIQAIEYIRESQNLN